ncbi:MULTISPECIES: HlyD family secretion protein [Psychrilyobacter]|uniref:HlyD family efflux transporter periplasmic adaptor subunit n=1 Tax=Psychrilyobacter piezotolerans TaxID=2293438 RepID=A0ABX9KJL6_9FUSO|nr:MULTISPECIES: HlyD family secretion protein [Psychrilyobacter]MCS5421072.1 HlyD family secretion protein [Psychrilyobacter sp. S5]NDI76765.1 HlyD family secretion protein [Psychrilyobacter piezotolerans]RDE65049.1 HlyD family secretion protein [Psychrilyobacter sp. S5]REI42619.1 HlyD family efflux transporter periplasmic adaptor subunit [Psychrilyobacter piezotolerans]
MSEIIKTNDNLEDKKDIKQEDNKGKAKKKIAAFIGGMAVVGILYSLYFFLFLNGYETTENAYVTGNQTAVTAQIAGRITQINFVDTAQVKKGDLLIEFEDTDYQLALEGAEIALAQAVRDYSSLETNVSECEYALGETMNNLANVKRNYDRNFKLFNAGIISSQQMDGSTTQLKNAKLAVSQRKEALSNAKLQASSKDAYSHPAVRNAILKYKQASLNLSRTKVYAPVDGIVAKKSISLGQKIGIGYPLFSVVDLNNEWVEVNLKENQMKHVKIGNTVELTSSLNEKVYKGYIVGVSAGTGNAFSLLPPQNASGNWIKIVQRLPVRVAFDKKSLEDNGVLPLGTTMEAEVDTKIVEDSHPNIEIKSSNPYTLDIQKIKKTIDHIVKANSY